MSLINQMLKDLEKRKQRELDARSTVLPPGLRPVIAERRYRWLKPMLGVGLLVVSATVAWVGYGQLSARPSPVVPAGIGLNSKPAVPPAEAVAVPQNPPVAVVPAPPVVAVQPEPAPVKAETPVLPQAAANPQSAPAIATTPPKIAAEVPTPAVETPKPTANTSEAVASSPTAGQASNSPPANIEKPFWRRTKHRHSRRQAHWVNADDDSTGPLLRRAERYLAEGQWAAAVDVLERDLALDPTQNSVRALLAKSYAAGGNLNQAADLLAAIPSPQMDQSALKLRTNILLKKGDNRQAGELLNQSLTAHPDDPEWRSMKALLEQRQGDHRAAAARYEGLIREKPAQSQYWLGLAISLEAQERFEEAREAYQRARATGAPTAAADDYIGSRLQALQGR